MKRPNIQVIATAEAAVLAMALVFAIARFTNPLDTRGVTWDFRYYIAMAQDGFRTPGASPFAYRYVTTLIVHALIGLPGIPIEQGFRIVAYVGAFLQLFGVFLFTQWFTRSTKGAYIALIVTAFSLFNVKFLFFDLYRPDHLAYALILLQTYLAFKRKFVPLLVVTLIASQVREFNIIPLIAYLAAFLRDKDRPAVVREVSVSIVALILAIGLPRLLIPVAENFQFAALSRNGILRVLIAPLVLSRDVNYLYTLIAYLLPILMLARLSEIRRVLQSLPVEVRNFLAVYTGLVLVFSFLGGTDFFRFATYLFMPQAILLGFLVPRSHVLEVAVMGVGVLVFNRIWMQFPQPSQGGVYMDLYGGYSTRFNGASVLRLLECLGFIGVGILVRRFHHAAGLGSQVAANDLDG
ncbi:MAG TPA: hypothetical protein VF784_15085 [Anaerolineales bacterium]